MYLKKQYNYDYNGYNIFCISPIDGRYNKYTNPLSEYFSNLLYLNID